MTFRGIPARVQKALEKVGGTIEEYDLRGTHLSAYLTAPAGKVWASTLTHDITIELYTLKWPGAKEYWDSVIEDIEGTEDCDNGVTTDMQGPDGRCERCSEES